MAAGAGQGAAGTARLRARLLGRGRPGRRRPLQHLRPDANTPAIPHPPRPYTGRAAAAAGPPTSAHHAGHPRHRLRDGVPPGGGTDTGCARRSPPGCGGTVRPAPPATTARALRSGPCSLGGAWPRPWRPGARTPAPRYGRRPRARCPPGGDGSARQGHTAPPPCRSGPTTPRGPGSPCRGSTRDATGPYGVSCEAPPWGDVRRGHHAVAAVACQTVSRRGMRTVSGRRGPQRGAPVSGGWPRAPLECPALYSEQMCTFQRIIQEGSLPCNACGQGGKIIMTQNPPATGHSGSLKLQA